MPCASAAPPSPRRATGVPANSSKILLERRNLDAMPPYAPPVSPAPDERAQPARVPAPKHPAFSRSIAGATLAGDCSFFLSSCSMRAQSLCRCSTCAPSGSPRFPGRASGTSPRSATPIASSRATTSCCGRSHFGSWKSRRPWIALLRRWWLGRPKSLPTASACASCVAYAIAH